MSASLKKSKKQNNSYELALLNRIVVQTLFGSLRVEP